MSDGHLRVVTDTELREMFLERLRDNAKYWCDKVTGPSYDVSTREGLLNRLNGVTFSICSLLDGVTLDFPAVALVARTHPSDEEYCLENNLPYIPDGLVLNHDVYLHDEYYQHEGVKTMAVNETEVTTGEELSVVVSSDNAELRGVVTSLIADTLETNGFTNVANTSRDGIDSEVIRGSELSSAMAAIRERGSSVLTAQIVLAQDYFNEDDAVGELAWSATLTGSEEPESGDDGE